MATETRSVPSRAQWRRRLALRRRDKVAFVFSGGGPLGALQVGALKALFEHGIKPDLAVGTSVGALNATFMGFEPSAEGVQRLEGMWRSLTDGDLFPGGRFRATWARMLVRGNRVFENSGLRKMIETNLGDRRFEDAQIPIAAVATNLENGEERVFTTGPVLEPLLASAAMPGIFPPVTIDGVTYTDGGIANNVPIAPAVAMGARTVYVLDATAHGKQRRPLVRPMDHLLHAFSLARGKRLSLDVQYYSDKAKLVILPAPHLEVFVPFASMEHTDMLINAAYEETARFLSSKLSPSEPDTGGRVEVTR